MYNQSNFRRDMATTIAIFSIGLVAVAGGAMATKPPTKSGPLNAGATMESEPVHDAFDRGAKELTETPESRKQQEPQKRSEQAEELDSETKAADASDIRQEFENPANTSVTSDESDSDDNKQSTSHKPTTTRLVPKPVAARPVNPVEQKEAPLSQLSDAEIKQRLAEYRAWVHKGELSIELDMSALSAEQLKVLVDFYVLRTDTTTLQISTEGDPSLLIELPDGRLVTDLRLDKHWPGFARVIASKWFGDGPTEKNLTIVLNDKAELQLYRILVAGLGGKHPESGGHVLVGVRPGDGSLEFEVLKLTPQKTQEGRL